MLFESLKKKKQSVNGLNVTLSLVDDFANTYYEFG